MQTTRLIMLSVALLAAQLFPLSAAISKDIYADQAPPPPKDERAPGPRDGYIWGQGHWEWSGKSYFWVNGNWVVQRHGMRYIPDHWVEETGRWHFVASHWEKT